MIENKEWRYVGSSNSTIFLRIVWHAMATFLRGPCCHFFFHVGDELGGVLRDRGVELSLITKQSKPVLGVGEYMPTFKEKKESDAATQCNITRNKWSVPPRRMLYVRCPPSRMKVCVLRRLRCPSIPSNPY